MSIFKNYIFYNIYNIYNLHGQIMLCFYKALANLKTMIWVMIYHKLISNPKYQKCVLTLRGASSNNEKSWYAFTQRLISNLKFYSFIKSWSISKHKYQKFVLTLTNVLMNTDILGFAHITSQSETSNLKKKLTKTKH